MAKGPPLRAVSDTTSKTWVTRQVQKCNIYLNNPSSFGIMYKSEITSTKNKLHYIHVTTALFIHVANMGHPDGSFLVHYHICPPPHIPYTPLHPCHTLASTTLHLLGWGTSLEGSVLWYWHILDNNSNMLLVSYRTLTNSPCLLCGSFRVHRLLPELVK